MNQQIKLGILAAGIVLSHLATAQETGIAAVYQDNFIGSKTASGQEYQKDKLTAAHKIHPMGTQLKVTRTDERARRSVVVTINDRGPYISGRIIELSHAAAKKIGITSGSANVMIEVIGKNEPVATTTPRAAAPAPAPKVNTQPVPPTTPAPVVEKPKPSPVPAAKPVAQTLQAKSGTPPAAKPDSKEVDLKKYPLVRGNDQASGLFKIALHHAPNKGFGVQVMALKSADQVLEEVAILQGKWFDNILVKIQPGTEGLAPTYKLILGPFNTAESAKNYAESLKKKYKMDGFVVDLTTTK